MMNIINNKTIIVFLTVLTVIAIAGCQQQPPIMQPPVSGGIGTYTASSFDIKADINTNTFKSQSELANFLREKQGSSNYGYYRGGDIMIEESLTSGKMAAPSAAPIAADTATGSAGASRDYSKTNVQVESVDEADIIKTDGNYIYTVSDTVLYIIKAYPGEEAKVVSTIKFDNQPSSLFIDGDYVAVFGNFYNNDYFKTINFRPRYGMSFFNIYNVKDKENPKLEKEYKFEGNYFNARMFGKDVYFLTSTYPQYRLDPPMPVMFDGLEKRVMPVSDIYYYDIAYQNPMFVNIHSISLADLSQEVNSKSIMVEGSQQMYMSEKNIYITYTEYVNEWDIERTIRMEILEPKLSEADKQLVAKIKQADNDILSKAEKDNKIYMVYESYMNGMTQDEIDTFNDEVDSKLKAKLEEFKYFEYTVINKINVEDGKISPVANGKVPGYVYNQFAMDEKDGVLRIATTINARWSRFGQESTKSTNNVYTLDSELKQLDALEGLAENEQIYSTRFIDDRLYMVTFRQVDPFFAIDLSDPKDIKELGKLKIPGFSRYLHPYDKNIIIGIGQDATDTGRTKGIKISLFDVSDVENPKEIAKYVTEARYATSTALYEHKAFLFSKEKNLLVIPAYNFNYEDKSQNYNGAFVFEIKKDSIKLRGLIDHSQGMNSQEYYWQPGVERSLYIENLLYTKSPSLLRINNIEDLKSVNNVTLKYESPGIPVY